MPSTLIATVGGQPQVVTFMLDLLLERGELIDQVEIVYLSSYMRTPFVFEQLEAEFKGDHYRTRPCQLHRLPIRLDGEDLEDIRGAEDVEAVRQNFDLLLARVKGEGRCIHLGLSGGRRLLSLVALASAMQYLTPADSLWHLHIPPEFDQRSRNGRVMHAPASAGVRLLAVPYVPWVAFFPGLANLLKRSPQEMGEASLGWLEADERARCSRVWSALTPRQREALQAFAEGLSRKQAAERLGIALTTVDSHRKSILAECRLVWEAQAGVPFDDSLLQKDFGPFLAGLRSR